MITQDPRIYAGATGRDLHIDTPLTNMTIGYRPQGMIADQILPVITVGKKNDGFYVWSKDEWLRLNSAHRAQGQPAKVINFQVSSDTYATLNYALRMDLDLEDVANADQALELRTSAANMVMDNLTMNWEDRIAVLLGNTTNHGSNETLAINYSVAESSTPIADLDDGIESVKSTTGYKPNKAIFGGQTWRRFRRHTDIIDFIRGKGDHVGGGGVTEAQVAGAFGFDQVLIGDGVKNLAGEGEPAAYTDIWSNTIALIHVPRAPGRMIPAYGYTFQWRPAGFPAPFVVDRYEIRERHVEAVEVHHWQDEKVTATALGYVIIGG